VSRSISRSLILPRRDEFAGSRGRSALSQLPGRERHSTPDRYPGSNCLLSCAVLQSRGFTVALTHQNSADVTSFVTFDTTQDTEIESETGAISQLDFCLRTGGKRANERKLRSGDWHGDTPAERTAQPKSRRASKKNEAYRCSQRRSRGAISKRQGMDTTGAVRSALLAS
jgi:hypothetical protein